MALTQLSLNAVLTFALQSVTNFGKNTTGATTETFAPLNINLATWSNVFAAEFTIFVTAPTIGSAVLVAGGTLSQPQAYYYKVTAVGPHGANGSIESGPSGEVTATTTSLDKTITVTWTALQGATSYNIYRGTTTGTENLLVGTSTGTSFTDTGFAGTSASPPSAPNIYEEFDLHSFTDLANNSVTAGHILGWIVLPQGTGATCDVTPGASNGLTWYWTGTTPSLSVPINGIEYHFGDPAGTGTVLDSSHKTIRITNNGSPTLTVVVVAVVGP